MSSGERDVGALEDLAPGTVRTVQVAGWRVCLANDDGVVFAVRDECLHRSGSLGHGRLVDGRVVCPLHGWRFDLRTGASVDHPEQSLRVYPVRVVGDRVLVTVPTPATGRS